MLNKYETYEDTFRYLKEIPTGWLLEFGLYNANSFKRLLDGAVAVGRPFEESCAFDSFCGLPEEEKGCLINPEWPSGAFNVCADYKTDLVGAIKLIRDKIGDKPRIVPGFFADTLNDELSKEFTDKCSYCSIDCDIKLSTSQCLDWLFKHKILKVGAVIRMDDWLSLAEWCGGNSLAWLISTEQFGVKTERLSTNVFKFLGYKD